MSYKLQDRFALQGSRLDEVNGEELILTRSGYVRTVVITGNPVTHMGDELIPAGGPSITRVDYNTFGFDLAELQCLAEHAGWGALWLPEPGLLITRKCNGETFKAVSGMTGADVPYQIITGGRSRVLIYAIKTGEATK